MSLVVLLCLQQAVLVCGMWLRCAVAGCGIWWLAAASSFTSCLVYGSAVCSESSGDKVAGCAVSCLQQAVVMRAVVVGSGR